MSSLYLWLKAFHLIAVIFWMAGLLYLPRLFVYHSAAKPGGELEAKMEEAEVKLLRTIMNPAMIHQYRALCRIGMATSESATGLRVDRLSWLSRKNPKKLSGRRTSALGKILPTHQ